MLKLQSGQIDVLAGRRRESFIAAMVELLTRKYPEEAARVGEGALRAFVQRAHADALTHGFATEQQIRLYLTLATVFGQDFATRADTAWAGEILGDRRLSPDEKLARILDIAAFERRPVR